MLSVEMKFEDHRVRVVGDPEAPEWIAADVCKALGIRAHRSVIRSLDPDEKGVHSVHSLGGAQEMATLTEPGLYRLIFKSRKARARTFARWVFHEVLPAIRKTGRYDARDAGALGSALEEAGKAIQQMNAVVQQQASTMASMASSAATIMALTRWHRCPNPGQALLPFDPVTKQIKADHE